MADLECDADGASKPQPRFHIPGDHPIASTKTLRSGANLSHSDLRLALTQVAFFSANRTGLLQAIKQATFGVWDNNANVQLLKSTHQNELNTLHTRFAQAAGELVQASVYVCHANTAVRNPEYNGPERKHLVNLYHNHYLSGVRTLKEICTEALELQDHCLPQLLKNLTPPTEETPYAPLGEFADEPHLHPVTIQDQRVSRLFVYCLLEAIAPSLATKNQQVGAFELNQAIVDITGNLVVSRTHTETAQCVVGNKEALGVSWWLIESMMDAWSTVEGERILSTCLQQTVTVESAKGEAASRQKRADEIAVSIFNSLRANKNSYFKKHLTAHEDGTLTCSFAPTDPLFSRCLYQSFSKLQQRFRELLPVLQALGIGDVALEYTLPQGNGIHTKGFAAKVIFKFNKESGEDLRDAPCLNALPRLNEHSELVGMSAYATQTIERQAKVHLEREGMDPTLHEDELSIAYPVGKRTITVKIPTVATTGTRSLQMVRHILSTLDPLLHSMPDVSLLSFQNVCAATPEGYCEGVQRGDLSIAFFTSPQDEMIRETLQKLTSIFPPEYQIDSLLDFDVPCPSDFTVRSSCFYSLTGIAGKQKLTQSTLIEREAAFVRNLALLLRDNNIIKGYLDRPVIFEKETEGFDQFLTIVAEQCQKQRRVQPSTPLTITFNTNGFCHTNDMRAAAVVQTNDQVVIFRCSGPGSTLFTHVQETPIQLQRECSSRVQKAMHAVVTGYNWQALKMLSDPDVLNTHLFREGVILPINILFNLAKRVPDSIEKLEKFIKLCGEIFVDIGTDPTLKLRKDDSGQILILSAHDTPWEAFTPQIAAIKTIKGDQFPPGT